MSSTGAERGVRGRTDGVLPMTAAGFHPRTVEGVTGRRYGFERRAVVGLTCWSRSCPAAAPPAW
jgi:hypothetical protein